MNSVDLVQALKGATIREVVSGGLDNESVSGVNLYLEDGRILHLSSPDDAASLNVTGYDPTQLPQTADEAVSFAGTADLCEFCDGECGSGDDCYYDPAGEFWPDGGESDDCDCDMCLPQDDVEDELEPWIEDMVNDLIALADEPVKSAPSINVSNVQLSDTGAKLSPNMEIAELHVHGDLHVYVEAADPGESCGIRISN